jgi:hypothetical protein
VGVCVGVSVGVAVFVGLKVGVSDGVNVFVAVPRGVGVLDGCNVGDGVQVGGTSLASISASTSVLSIEGVIDAGGTAVLSNTGVSVLNKGASRPGIM